MTPRNRKPLDVDSPDFAPRFAIHLRELVAARKLTTPEFHEALQAQGLDVSRATVVKWLNGERLPRVGDLEHIGAVLKCRDYRMVLPPSQAE
jgi:transcriptional regulator with XRE-family HTH domain